MANSDDVDGRDSRATSGDTPSAPLGAQVVPFPFSRVRPRGRSGPARDLGMGKMAEVLGVPREQLSGHWCSRCHGIWYGYLLEVECPVCGNRNG